MCQPHIGTWQGFKHILRWLGVVLPPIQHEEGGIHLKTHVWLCPVDKQELLKVNVPVTAIVPRPCLVNMALNISFAFSTGSSVLGWLAVELTFFMPVNWHTLCMRPESRLEPLYLTAILLGPHYGWYRSKCKMGSQLTNFVWEGEGLDSFSEVVQKHDDIPILCFLWWHLKDADSNLVPHTT